tara:strand:+ start:210 stop:1142 length:933 start_codon:yes stop_codon:yes gene_type:complete
MSTKKNNKINNNRAYEITFLISHYYRENFLYSLLDDILKLSIKNYQILVLDNSKTLINHNQYKNFFNNENINIILLEENLGCIESRIFLSTLPQVRDSWCFFLDDDINFRNIKISSLLLNEILKIKFKFDHIRTFKVIKPNGKQRKEEVISKSKKVKITSNFLGGASLFSPNLAAKLYSKLNMRGYGFEEYLLSYFAYESNTKIIYDPRLSLIHHKAPYIDKKNKVSKIRRATGWEMALRKSDICLKILPIPFNLIGFFLWKIIQFRRWIKEPASSGLIENVYLHKQGSKYKRLGFFIYLKYLKNGGRIF